LKALLLETSIRVFLLGTRCEVAVKPELAPVQPVWWDSGVLVDDFLHSSVIEPKSSSFLASCSRSRLVLGLFFFVLLL
jgi:hypothetical protein